MGVEIRSLTTEEAGELRRVTRYAYADTSAADAPVMLPPEWSCCAFVDGRLATTFGVWPLRMRLDGRSAAVGGVTFVATDPEFRRRGLLRQVMTKSLADQRDSGVAFSALWASMGAIYQRFGFGLATTDVTYVVDRRTLAFRGGEPASGATRVLPTAEARPAIEALYKEFARPRNLMVQRAPLMWDFKFQALETQSPPRATHVAVYSGSDGTPRGYVVVQLGRVELERPTGLDQVVHVVDWAALDADAYRGLWEFLAAHDLACRVRWEHAPPDDPAPHLVLEPRDLGVQASDGVWFRVNDVEAGLPQRRYHGSGALTVAVRDDVCPWNEGCYSMEVVDGEAEVRRVRAGEVGDPDLVVDAGTLAVLVSGHARASVLARAGLVVAADPSALRLADGLFSVEHAPWCPDIF